MARDFEVIDLQDEGHRMLVEIEFLDDRSRKQFGYPKGNGWEQEIDGEPKFLHDIRKQVSEREKRKSIDVADLKQKVKGAKVAFDKDHPQGKTKFKKK